MENNEHEISLNQARNVLLNSIDSDITLHAIRVHNLNVISLYECDLVYLHLQIIFKSPNEVDLFLDNYSNLHGVYATQMFVNNPIWNENTNSFITPMNVAILWNNDPNMLRILYRWGANPIANEENVNNAIMPSYRNYLSRYQLSENRDNYNYPLLRGQRIRNEFYLVNQENLLLSGAGIPNNEWVLPARVQIPSHNTMNIY
tara:strand:+ start:5886 stop:6491 length:606 start_codon:yes stop_codon:yes gene_type:complete